MAYRGADPTDVMGRRIGAYLLDSLIFGIILAAALIPTALRDWETVPSGTVSCQQMIDEASPGRPVICSDDGTEVRYIPTHRVSGLQRLAWGVTILEWLGFYVLMQGTLGGSPGKLILGLRVVKPNGSIAGMGRCFVRTILLPIDALCCGFLPGLIVANRSKGHRRLGDMAGDTLVIGADDQKALMLARSGAKLPDRKTLAAVQYAEEHRPDGLTWEDRANQIQIPGAPTLPGANVDGSVDPLPPPMPEPEEATKPVWDNARQTYLWFDPSSQTWVQWNESTNTWGPLDA